MLNQGFDFIKQITSSKKGIFTGLFILVTAIAVPITISQVQQQQDLRQRASGISCTTNGQCGGQAICCLQSDGSGICTTVSNCPTQSTVCAYQGQSPYYPSKIKCCEGLVEQTCKYCSGGNLVSITTCQYPNTTSCPPEPTSCSITYPTPTPTKTPTNTPTPTPPEGTGGCNITVSSTNYSGRCTNYTSREYSYYTLYFTCSNGASSKIESQTCQTRTELLNQANTVCASYCTPPTSTPTPTRTPTPRPTSTPIPTNTPVPTNTPAPTNTPLPTATPVIPTPTPTQPATPPICDTNPVCTECIAPENTCGTSNGTMECQFTQYSGGGTCTPSATTVEVCGIEKCTYGYWCISEQCKSISGSDSEPTGTALTCDPQKDGEINLLDYNVWRDEVIGVLNTKESDCFNPDNEVNLLDFNVWRDIMLGVLQPF